MTDQPAPWKIGRPCGNARPSAPTHALPRWRRAFRVQVIGRYFIGSGLFTGVSGQLRFAVTAPGVTTIAGDVNGDKVSDFHITLTGTVALVAGDFVL